MPYTVQSTGGFDFKIYNILFWLIDVIAIWPFHNPFALIWFKCDSRLGTLHSGRWVDMFWFQEHLTYIFVNVAIIFTPQITTFEHDFLLWSCRMSFSYLKEEQSISQSNISSFGRLSSRKTHLQHLPSWKYLSTRSGKTGLLYSGTSLYRGRI